VIDLDDERRARLFRQTMAGDTASQIRWLAKYGRPEHRQAAEEMGYQV
jgi:hypothetical protein